MSCLVPPQTLEEFLGVINSCAASYGGPDWIQTAFLGLLTIALAGLAATALLASWRAR